MKRFRLVQGNRLEILSQVLSEILKTPVSSPLDPEIFIVQSQGMSRWLSMEIARHLGISANLKFLYPNEFVQFVFNRLLPDFSESTLNDASIVTWILMRLMPELSQDNRFDKIRQYLDDDPGGIKQFQLAGRLADTIDQYLLYRPEMIRAWEDGEGRDWQADLWRRLADEGNRQHRARQIRILTDFCRKHQSLPPGFPERITVFGISALPEFHMQLLDILSRFLEVNLFLMNPCREYWGDILSNREIARQAKPPEDATESADLLYLEQGNPLLAAMGTMGRDFFDMVQALECEQVDVFSDPGRDSLLHCIQSDILDLRPNGIEDGVAVEIDQTDPSVTIHACHSPMREMEVLHNHILSFFEADESLTPGNILVMTPDIETYAPYIHAVFNRPTDDPQWMPYRIADRTMLDESMMIRTFFSILSLHNSRFRLTEIMGILESPEVRNRYRISDADMDLIQQWVTDTRIRWGIDAAFREKIGLPAIPANTWEAGLERLLLGYAMRDPGGQTFQGILPADAVEGGNAEALGKLLAFLQSLFATARSLSADRTIPEWGGFVEKLLQDFFPTGDAEDRDIQAIREACRTMQQNSDAAGFTDTVSIDVITCHLTELMEKKGFGSGFISGGITFSAMLPMRSIPFDVICLLGMNHDAYPRQDRDTEFNLIAKHPRPGDRSRRNDDQYLFLESILSARKYLYVSYTGKGIQDNSTIPPSVLVSELLQYIEAGYGMARTDILTEHKLQPFHSAYFTPAGKDARPDTWFSYSETDLAGAVCLQSRQFEPSPFFPEKLPAPEITEIDLTSFLRFFENPCRYIINQQLGIYLGRPEDDLEDREPFAIDSLERFQLSNELLEKKIQGVDYAASFECMRARGVLPHQQSGETIFHDFQDRTDRFYRKLAPYIQKEKHDPLEVRLSIDNVLISGRIEPIYPEYAFFYRYGAIRPKDQLLAWIRHLIINCIRQEGYPLQTMVAGREEKTSWSEIRFAPADDAAERLTDLMRLYRNGLEKPLPFFPRSSYRFAELERNPQKTIAEAIQKAEETFIGSEYGPAGEGNDPYCRLCFGHDDPLGEEFQKIALAVFQPMMTAIQDTQP